MLSLLQIRVEFHEDHVATICPLVFSCSQCPCHWLSGCHCATADKTKFQWCPLLFNHLLVRESYKVSFWRVKMLNQWRNNKCMYRLELCIRKYWCISTFIFACWAFWNLFIFILGWSRKINGGRCKTWIHRDFFKWLISGQWINISDLRWIKLKYEL